jgi:hypothetical protein
MPYAGYRVKIGNTIISNDLIQKGTYSFQKPKRIAGSWKDEQQIEHQQVLSNRKVAISFSIRERELADQETITGIFATQENLTVEYWDDYDCTYKTGTFYMNAPKISHVNSSGGSLFYAATPIQLTEY